ncbi:hypothetical protein UC34_22445 [Pandoraea vervacti]|uniref:Transposase n=1 Tax=Pandoraea vervacti TaxID=656178 RepID=A0ABN4FT81_9BURK|nr:transposase [Pandoraea vervacti]AJP58952.1 hypothetical protein UC34_22445 [Pandoraea vervacti]
MTEFNSDLTLTVTCVGRNGKRRYDAESKQRLIEASLQRGVSVAGLALKAGVNANQLRRWIRLYQERGGRVGLSGQRIAPVPTIPSSFIPVLEIPHGSAPANVPASASPPLSPCTPMRAQLSVEMPNGVTLRLDCTEHDASLVSAMIESLGRCDVQARR